MAERSPEQHDARRLLMQWIFGSRATEVLVTALRLNIPETLGDDGADVADLARSCDVPAGQLNRLMRTLASLGLCTEPSPGRYALTEAGSLLRAGHPDSLGDFARFHTSPVALEPWSRLESSLRTGRTAFDEHFGVPLYEYFADKPELTATFNAAMSQESNKVAVELPGHYDFGRYDTVMDIGGGDGTLLASILRRHPGVKGVVFESAEGAAQAAGTVKDAGLEERCSVATGDFFRSVPSGADLLVIKSVIHNWDDERATAILRNCREALPEHGRLIVVEVVLPETVTPDTPELNPYIKDLQMQILVSGKERTRSDFEELCARAGLRVTEVFPLPSYTGFSIVEAERA
ncbi:methyltransferase [Streptomyces sp. AV19]|uniref:methyltransferase n=1 Tax=Streptomyces sp. AV19 TaxID=2793068 RepID=UPI0018FEF193|nr:methyltransferase [Streptomyces sp. AV19]MBH1938493.1 methyltransferase [Streptomyces sp. AV19]MDG4535142.1 acetylserotonin O-methyltransferase [Streptomyces sp. AV19]